MKSVFIALPIHKVWSHESEGYLKKNIEAAKNWKLHSLFTLYEESLIQRARNKCVDEFLKSDADYLFFLDDDIVLIEPFAIDVLVSRDKDIIGGAYIMKKPPHKPVFYPIDKKDYDLRKHSEPVEVILAGTGSLLIKREVVETLAKTFKYPFDCFEVKLDEYQTYLSEDWGFCWRARKHGFKVFIEPTLTLGHLGTYAFSMHDYYALIEQGGKNA